MAGSIRNFLRGRETTAVLIEPVTVDSAGAITVVTASGKSIRGRCEGVSIRSRLVTEQIMSVDDVIANNMPLYDDYEVTIREILTVKTGSSYEPVLPKMWFTSGWDYFRLTLSKGGKTYTVYGVRSSMDDGVEGMGKQTSSMTLLPVNVNLDASGTASIAYGDTP